MKFHYNEKMTSTTDSFYNDTVCMNTIPQCKEYTEPETKSIIFILAKHPTQRSHSKTHWIRIENLQTKHEA